MSILDKFEQGIENAVNSTFSKGKRSDLKAVDYPVLLNKYIDKNTFAMSQDRTIAPNKFTLILSTKDFDNVESWGAETFADELARSIRIYAEKQRYTFTGPVSVTLEEDTEAEKGRVRIKSENQRGEIPDEPKSTDESDVKPDKYLEINNRIYPLSKEKTVVGRDVNVDITIPDSGISRKHFEIRLTSAGVVITDLGSTNGIYVEGHKTPAATLLSGNKIIAGKTTIFFYEN